MRIFARVTVFVGVIVATSCDITGPTGSPGGRVPIGSVLVWRNSSVVAEARPTFDDHAAYVLGSHVVTAVDKLTGALLWSTPLTYPPDVNTGHQGYGTAIAGGLVIIGDIDVFGLDPQSGAIVWRFAPRTQFSLEREFERLATDGATVYVGGVWGNVYAIDARTGAQRWTSPVLGAADSSTRVFNPVLSGSAVFVSFSDDHGTGGLGATTETGVASFNAATGQLNWSMTFAKQPGPFPSEGQGVAVTSTRVITVAPDGSIYALDRQSGVPVDSVPQSVLGFAYGPTSNTEFLFAANDTIVVVGTWYNGAPVAFDPRNLQRKLWASSLYDGAVWDLIIDSTRVYAVYDDGQLAVSDLATGNPVWWIARSDFPSLSESILWAPAIDVDRIYAGAGPDMYAFKKR